MKKLEIILANLFTSILNDLDGDICHISEYVSTEEIIGLCEELNLLDFKEKLIKYKKAYEEKDYDTFHKMSDLIYN